MPIGFFRRWIVFFLDSLLANLCSLIAFLFVLWISPEYRVTLEQFRGSTNSSANLEFFRSFPAVGIAWTLAHLIYFTPEIFCAASPIKLLFGYRIRDSNGAPATYGQLVPRFIFKHANYVGWLLATILTITIFGIIGSIVGFIWMIGTILVFGSDRMGLHDRFCDTAVFRNTFEADLRSPSLPQPSGSFSRRPGFDPNKELIGRKSDW